MDDLGDTRVCRGGLISTLRPSPGAGSSDCLVLMGVDGFSDEETGHDGERGWQESKSEFDGDLMV